MSRRLTGDEADLIGYWPLDEGEGTIAHDKTNNGNHGTIQGGASWEETEIGLVSHWPADGDATDVAGTNDGTVHGGVTFTSGKLGPAFRLNGTDAYVEIADATSLDISKHITMQHRLRGNERGLIAYWPLDEESGETVSDRTEGAHHGTIHRASWGEDALEFLAPPNPLVFQESTGPKALFLDGHGDYVATTLTNLSGDELTIEYWFKGRSIQSAVRQQSGGCCDRWTLAPCRHDVEEEHAERVCQLS